MTVPPIHATSPCYNPATLLDKTLILGYGQFYEKKDINRKPWQKVFVPFKRD